MRISDWSSDVCSSDLIGALDDPVTAAAQPAAVDRAAATIHEATERAAPESEAARAPDAEAYSESAMPAGERTASPGGYREEPVRRSGISPWVWAAGGAVVLLVLLLALG